MSTVQVRNDFGELRVCPSLGWAGVEPGEEVPVPVEDAYHWAAGGWTVLGEYPVPHHLYPNHATDAHAYALPAPEPEELPVVAAVSQPAEPVPAVAPVAPAALPAAAPATPLESAQ